MLVQRCALDQHRLILPVSVTKPQLSAGAFSGHFSPRRFRALVDTGAQRSVLAKSVIAELSLFRTGHMEFAGLHGSQTHSRYLAAIGFWARRVESGAATTNLDDTELSLFSIEEPFEVVDMTDNANFDLILGFDVLKLFSFSFDHRSKMFELIVNP